MWPSQGLSAETSRTKFIILAQTGKSEVFCHKDYLDMSVPAAEGYFDDVEGLQAVVSQWTSHYAATSDMHDAAAFAKVPAEHKVSARGSKWAIFRFRHEYSEPMKAVVVTQDGKDVPVHMGSYGLGRAVSSPRSSGSARRCGNHWPEAVAPFKVAILNLKQGSSDTNIVSEQFIAGSVQGIEVLYHDLDEPGRQIRLPKN